MQLQNIDCIACDGVLMSLVDDGEHWNLKPFVLLR
jgi:hypothetical protein